MGRSLQRRQARRPAMLACRRALVYRAGACWLASGHWIALVGQGRPHRAQIGLRLVVFQPHALARHVHVDATHAPEWPQPLVDRSRAVIAANVRYVEHYLAHDRSTSWPSLSTPSRANT